MATRLSDESPIRQATRPKNIPENALNKKGIGSETVQTLACLFQSPVFHEVSMGIGLLDFGINRSKIAYIILPLVHSFLYPLPFYSSQ